MAKKKVAAKKVAETVGDAVEAKWATEATRLAREVERLNQRCDNLADRIVFLEDNAQMRPLVQPEDIRRWSIVRMFRGR